MKKLILAFVLLLQTVALAEQCYFQTRRISYDSVTKVKKISCQTLKNAQQDVYFYNGNDNYARYFGSQFGKEGNLIVEIDGKILITKFYYAWGEYRYYGQIIYSGANVMSCKTTTSTGYCDQVEYNDFAMYLRDFLSSSVRKKKHNEYSCPKGQYAVNEIECEKLPKNAIRLPETGFECKTGFELYEDDDVAYCYKPYQCPKGQYAVDETECESLPKNAIRLPQDGFVCKKGFELYTNDDTTYCYKPYQCPKGHYAISKNECSLLPKNAKRFAEEGYECLKGYVKIGEDCVKKASCKKNEFYQEWDNKCYGLPEHAQWNEYASSEDDYVCDEGYANVVSTRECREKITSCGADSVISKNLYSCERIPVNSHKVSEYQWLCDDGYGRQFDYCSKIISCDGKNEYPISEFECGIIPDHAHRVGGNWECDYGFKKNYNVCDPYCTAYQILDTLANRCIDVPVHAHKVNLYTAYCNTGYHVEGDDCVRNETYQESGASRPYNGYGSNTYYNFNMMFRLQFEGFLGGTFYEKQPTYSKNEMDNHVLGLGVGLSLESDFNENFSIGITNSIRAYITEYNLSYGGNDFSNCLFRDDISVSLLLGSEKYKFLLRPVFSIQLIENASINDSKITYKIDNTTWAIELGVRFGSNHDLFIAFSQPVIEKMSFFKSINRMIWGGYRYNFTFSSKRI